MEEQDNGRNRDASNDPAAAGAGTASPTGDGAGAAPLSGSSARGGGHRGGPGTAVRVRRAVQTIMNLLAVTVRAVAYLFAAVLVVRIGLAFVPVNPNNVIVEWIVRVADVLVLDFRNLFLPADPRIALVVNYGLAAVFWLAVGMIAAWVLSGFGRLVAGRSRR
jgi:hypothetical protein